MEEKSNENSEKENSSENSSSKDDKETEINNILVARIARCRNSILASQFQKVLPDMTKTEKRGSLHAVLQQLSEESLILTPEHPYTKEKQVTFHIPKKSLYSNELIIEEYVLPAKKNKLLSDSFVRNLPVPIEEKRLYRNSIAYSFKRKPWYTKVYDFAVKKFSNIQARLEFWHDTLKVIEGKHGAAMVSYFLFIRWLLYMNIIIFLLHLFFIVLPQCLFFEAANEDFGFSILNSAQDYLNVSKEVKLFEILSEELYLETSKGRKGYFIMHSLQFHTGENITNASSIDEIVSYCQKLYADRVANSSHASGGLTAIQNLLQGTGPLEPTLLFMGFYNTYGMITDNDHIYNMPFAFICVILATFVVCFIMMIQYTSTGIQEAFLARTKRSNYYSNEVFSAWDYCIAKPVSAEQQHYRFVLRMKINLSEDRIAKEVMGRSTAAWAKLYVMRLLINIFIVLWLFACYYLIYEVAMFQMRKLQEHQLTSSGLRTLFIQFLAPVTIIILNSISPIIFSLLVTFENYHAQTQLNLSLFRNVFLYLSSIIVLLNTFYQQIACKPKDICGAGLSTDCRSPRCWETYVGQQLFRLTLTDLFVYIGVFLGHDVIRNYVTRKFDNKFTQFVGRLQFFLPTEVLAPINSQTILWLGVFYSPLLPLIMILKLIIIFYIKKTKVLKFCDPSEHSFRASRFNAMFIMVLMISFFAVLIVQSFAIESIPPSRGCGPFRNYNFITEAVPESIRHVLSLLLSFWTIICAAILLCVAIHYYRGILISQKELAKRLRAHLVLQSNDKQFLLQKIADLTNGKSSKIKL